MADERILLEQLDLLRAATALAADQVVAREKDGSFLEKTLRDALAAQLPGADTEHLLNLDRREWPGRLGGVDVLYLADGGGRIGVETKVWDVADSLYDTLKLAAGTQSRTLAAGFCVMAGRAQDWRATSAMRDMSASATAITVEREVAAVLEHDERGWARIWSRTSIRPTALPARIRTVAGKAVTMPRVPGHEIRFVGVQAIDDERIRLDELGNVVGA